MIATIIGALVVGLIVGVLARLVMPGKQNIGVIMTVLLGAIGSFLGTWVGRRGMDQVQVSGSIRLQRPSISRSK